MTRRSGVTLVEVLVAIFIMGIGLIALLTLFPIGMLRMARAIHDDRSAQSFRTAEANAIAHSLGTDIDVVSVPTDQYNRNQVNPDVFSNPCPFLPRGIVATPPSVAGLRNAHPYRESFPILVDPIGYYNTTGVAQDWVGGVEPVPQAVGLRGALRRRPVEFVRRLPVTVQQRNLRIFGAFTLWDEMGFEYDIAAGSPGAPKVVGGAALRDPRFSWGYTMQRPMSSDKAVVNVAVVVFDSRSLVGLPSEHVYPNTFFNPVKNTISIDYSGPGVVPPPIRSGKWIMDVTPYNPTPTTGAAHAYWYRVIGVEEKPGNIVELEVQQPIRGLTTFQGTVNPLLGFQGTSVILEGVAEVFDRGPMRLP